MENNREKFLDKYKKLEGILNKWKPGISVRDFEDGIPDQEIKNKLYTCRVLRNYIQHNADTDFVVVSNKMIKFLDEMYELVYGRISKNKDIMTPITKANTKTMKDSIIDVVKLLSTKGDVLILDESGKVSGIFSDISLQKIYLAGGNKKKIDGIKEYIKVPKKRVKFGNEEEMSEESIKLISENEVKMIIITDNGKSTGKVLGIITEKEVNKIIE